MDKIFEETIKDEEVQAINEKIKSVEEIYNGSFGYNNFEECKAVMHRGIYVIKHNYTNAECKRVMLKLSKDNKSLHYKAMEPDSKLMAKIKGDRVILFSKIKGFLYGAVSETFEHRRR